MQRGLIGSVHDVEHEIVSHRFQTVVQTRITDFMRSNVTSIGNYSMREQPIESSESDALADVVQPNSSITAFIGPQTSNELTEESVCHVCREVYNGNHFCKVCMRPVHVFCGRADTDEEGFGKPVTCFTCAP